MAEQSYEFRRRLNQVHAGNRRNPALKPAKTEIALDAGWRIAVAATASDFMLRLTADLQDYFLTSMQLSLTIAREAELAAAARSGAKVIVLGTKPELPDAGNELTQARSYRVSTQPDRIVICGNDERGAAQGSYYLEDLLNLREAPFIAAGLDQTRAAVFSPRMVHSGWGLDQFPDPHLNAMAHAGFDAVLVFVKGPNLTTAGPLDINDLIHRCAGFGLDVYLYSCLISQKHPDAPDALAYYEGTYGAVFAAHPKAKGIILVGESVEFPSHDTRTTGGSWRDKPAGGIPDARPTPGWWPCVDYPQWLEMLKKVIRRHSPEADIVFWTYNWGWAPEADRLALLRALPTDISLQVTFEMFEPVKRQGVTHVCVDYTAAFVGPGAYFASEAKVAHERGIRLYTMCNTGGLTWDFGVVPYEPVPFQWARRHAALLDANRNWGLSGLMESHHYGWFPSFVSELAKWAYWTPQEPVAQMAEKLACRDFGPQGGPLALQAWRDWSEAIRDYIPTNEDQYGPCRVGPSYPLVFISNFSRTFSATDAPIPSVPWAHFGSGIVFTKYHPLESPQQSPGPCRIGVEIASLQRMVVRWQQGIDALTRAVALAPVAKQADGARMLALGTFIRNTVITTIHVKQWWMCQQRLMVEADPVRANAILDELVAIAEREIANAEDTIPAVETDSRLGGEPSMEYMTDRERLEWKIRQVRSVLEIQIPGYRQALALTTPGQPA